MKTRALVVAMCVGLWACPETTENPTDVTPDVAQDTTGSETSPSDVTDDTANTDTGATDTGTPGDTAGPSDADATASPCFGLCASIIAVPCPNNPSSFDECTATCEQILASTCGDALQTLLACESVNGTWTCNDAGDAIPPAACADAFAPLDACLNTTANTKTIEDVLAADEGVDFTPPLFLDGVMVTYLKPDADFSNGFYLQEPTAADGSAPGPAVFVKTGNVGASTLVKAGDLINLAVLKTDKKGEAVSVTNFSNLEILSSGNDVSGLVQDLTGGGVVDASTLGELIMIKGATLLTGADAVWKASYGAGTITVYHPSFVAKGACVNMTFDVLAVGGVYDGEYQVSAFAPGDVTNVETSNCEVPDAKNWGFEASTSWDPPTGFAKSQLSDFSVVASADPVHTGTTAAAVTWTTDANRDLIALYKPAITPGVAYTAHAWVLDNDPCGRVRVGFTQYDGAGEKLGDSGFSSYSKDMPKWMHVSTKLKEGVAGETAAWVQVFLRFYDVQGCAAEGEWASASVTVDDLTITAPVTFDVNDNTADSGATSVVEGSSAVTALNDAYEVYLGAPAASAAQDLAIYVWTGAPQENTVSAPWNKAGTVAAPAEGSRLLVMIQEGSADYCEWREFNFEQNDWVTIDGSICQKGVFAEGTIELPIAGQWVTSGTVYYAIVPYGTNDGDILATDGQLPAGNGDENVDAAETTARGEVGLLVGQIVGNE